MGEDEFCPCCTEPFVVEISESPVPSVAFCREQATKAEAITVIKKINSIDLNVGFKIIKILSFIEYFRFFYELKYILVKLCFAADDFKVAVSCAKVINEGLFFARVLENDFILESEKRAEIGGFYIHKLAA